MIFWQKKESFDAKELEGEANARADELENQVILIISVTRICIFIDKFFLQSAF